MTPREAIRILMLSPFYFRLEIPCRKQLVKEFCKLFEQTDKKSRP
jgi:hypothetical protein